jgi:hypothetical protein
MSVHTIVRLDGYVKPEEIVNFISNNIATREVSTNMRTEKMDYIMPGYEAEQGAMFIYHNNGSEILFYCHDNINLKENLEYYIAEGLREMVESETTYLSMEYSNYSISIMKQIVEAFGGWINEIDQDDRPYYRVNKKGI